MPIPVIGTLAGVGIGIGAGIASGLTQAVLEPALRKASYKTNTEFPNLVPPPEMCYDAWARGHFGDPQEAINALQLLLKSCGIVTLPEDARGGGEAKDMAWWSALHSRRPRPGVGDLIRLNQRGYFGEKKRFNELMGWTGAKKSDWDEFAASSLYSLTLDQYMLGRLREVIDDDELTLKMSRIGVVSTDDQAIVNELLKGIPGISDIITMLVRDTFDPVVVAKRKLYDEFPPVVLEWAKKLGYGWDMGKMALPNGVTLDLTWALQYWMMHWQPLSPTMVYEFERRFRATGGPDGGPRNPNVGHWSRKMTEDALKVADYPPTDRPYLAEAAYYKPGLRQIREMHFYGSLPDKGGDKGYAEMREMYQDIGYNRDDAEKFADSTAKFNIRRRARELLNRSRSQIEEAVTVGVITDQQAIDMLMQLEYTVDQANAAVIQWRLVRSVKQLRKMIAGVRRNFLLGDYDRWEADTVLTRLKLTPDSIFNYLAVWEQEQRQWKLERTPRILTEWLYLGVIDGPEFVRRLERVGYPTVEVANILNAAIAAKKNRPPQELKVPRGKLGRGGMAKSGELTKGEIRAMHARGILSRDDADAELQALGLDLTDRERLFQLWG